MAVGVMVGTEVGMAVGVMVDTEVGMAVGVMVGTEIRVAASGGRAVMTNTAVGLAC